MVQHKQLNFVSIAMFPSWAGGILLSLTACCLANLGINLQKVRFLLVSADSRSTQVAQLRHEEEKQKRERERKIKLKHKHKRKRRRKHEETLLYCNRRWMGGLFLVLIGGILDLVSFTFAPVSLLAPMGAMTLLV